MLIFNVILVLALVGFIGAGFKDGFVHTAGRLIGAVIGFVLARSFSIAGGSFLSIFLPAGWARLLAFLFIFMFVTQIVGFLFKLADGVFKIISVIPFVKTINNILGAILGIVEGFIVIGGTLWVITNFDLVPFVTNLVETSQLASFIQATFETLLGILL